MEEESGGTNEAQHRLFVAGTVYGRRCEEIILRSSQILADAAGRAMTSEELFELEALKKEQTHINHLISAILESALDDRAASSA